jgi:hypothetical protein
MSRFSGDYRRRRDFDSCRRSLSTARAFAGTKNESSVLWRTAGMVWGIPANPGQIMPNVAISLHASAQQRVAPVSRVHDLEFLNRPFRRGRRIRCLDKADEFGGLSP